MADRRSPTASRRVTPADLRSVTPRPRPDGGTVIAVYGSRPDVGVATVATALALAFRSLGSEDVGLAELDPRRASRSRGQESAATVAVPLTDRVADTVDRVEVPGLDAALVRRPDGVWTLAMRPKTTPISDAKAVIVTVDAMRAKFPVSVASLGHQLNERALAAFDAADRIVLITEGAVPSVRGTQRVLRLCRRLNYPDEKMCVVVNRYNVPGSLAVADISTALRREVYWKIADEAEPELSGLASKLLEP